MLYKYLIQEGYLTLGLFILMNIVGILLNRHRSKADAKFSPFKRWTWNKPPDNYRALFYMDICFGTLFLIMAMLIINALGYAIMFGYLSLICWIIALRLFFRIRQLEHGTLGSRSS
jgi:predicted permease